MQCLSARRGEFMVWWNPLSWFTFDEEDMKKKLEKIRMSLKKSFLDENEYYVLVSLYNQYRRKIKRHWNKIKNKTWFESNMDKIDITREKARRKCLLRGARLRPSLLR
jgi:hypothetical protein